MTHISISIAVEVALDQASYYVKLGEIADCVVTGQLHPGNRLVFLQIIWVERRCSSDTALLTTACQAEFFFFLVFQYILRCCQFLRLTLCIVSVFGSLMHVILLAYTQQLTNLMNRFLFFNKFTIFLYMFRALLCSSSGGKIVLCAPAHRTATYRVLRYQMLYNTI